MERRDGLCVRCPEMMAFSRCIALSADPHLFFLDLESGRELRFSGIP